MPTREMDLSQYGRTIVPYSVSGNSDLALKLIKNLKIFLMPQNHELREVQGKTHRKDSVLLCKDLFVSPAKKGLNCGI